MALEETTCYPLVNCHPDRPNQSVHSLLVIVGFRRRLDSFKEVNAEGLERILVHGVHDIESD